MLRLSRPLCCCLILLGLLACLVPALAQGYENIYLANGLVARLRDTGPFNSLQERAAKVEQALIEVLSTQNTMEPEVRVQQDDGWWAVYCGSIRVLTVLPKEAEANSLPARQLAAIWAKNLRRQLPLATPASLMGTAARGAVASPPATAPASSTPTPAPATAAVTPAPPPPPATPPATPSPVSPAVQPPMTRTAAVFLLLESFNQVREMPQDQYLAQRDRMAANLLNNLRPFLTGQPVPALPPPPPAPTPPPPPEPTPAPTPAPTRATRAVTPPPAPVLVEPGTVTVPTEWADLPVKERVKKKFELAARPFYALEISDPELYQRVDNLLRAARVEKAAYNFEAAEGYLDGALALMGIIAPEQ